MKWIALALIPILLVLHQDFWNWHTADPLFMDFLPVGLWWHALFCAAAAINMALLVWTWWPHELEALESDPAAAARRQELH